MSRPNENPPMLHGPSPGSLVTYRHRRRYRIGVVVGPVVPEPTTGRPWVGVRVPHHVPAQALDLIDVAAIIDVRPPR